MSRKPHFPLSDPEESEFVHFPYALLLQGFTISHIEAIVRGQIQCDGPDRCSHCRDFVGAVECLKETLAG